MKQWLSFSARRIFIVAFSAGSVFGGTPAVADPAPVAPAAPTLDQIADQIYQVFAGATTYEHDQQTQGAPSAIMRRPVFSKAQGCLKGTFQVDSKLPAELRIGVFASQGYPAWARFSNDGAVGPDSVAVDKGGNPARGLAIKLVGVPGPKLLTGQETALTQDFLMENHPAFFAKNAADFLAFNQDFDGFMKSHPKEAGILNDIGARSVSDPLEIQYWTPTPYRLGPNNAMKYSARPCAPQAAWQKSFTSQNGDNYLRDNLTAHVKAAHAPGELCLDFYIQVYKDDATTPLDDAATAWDEKASPPIHAAQLVFTPGQDMNAPARTALCESLSFNGWHALEAHRPLGSLNEVRGIVYRKIAEMRKTYNNGHGHSMPTTEPTAIGAGD